MRAPEFFALGDARLGQKNRVILIPGQCFRGTCNRCQYLRSHAHTAEHPLERYSLESITGDHLTHEGSDLGVRVEPLGGPGMDRRARTGEQTNRRQPDNGMPLAPQPLREAL